ncbi:endoribonuclease L-PSP [Xylariaceae sp. FL1272]|nr:endoribonuclease L-PSP [Xylariaceae sp. FL1272]
MSPNGTAFVYNADAPEPATRYAHARVAPASAHRNIYVSGIACVQPDGTYAGVTEKPDGTYELDIRAQTAAILARIEDIIKQASSGKGGLENAIDSVVYLTDMKSQYAGMNEEWNKVFKTRASAPARATIGVSELPDPRFIVEIKITAVVEM